MRRAATGRDRRGSGALRLRGLVKRYPETVAVDGLDLDIEPGEFFSLLGASGCGKTTTLRLVAGFEQPDAGDITLDGQSLVGIPPHRRPVNTVFQSYSLFPFLSVADNVAFGLRYQSATKAETRERVARSLDLVEMTSYARRRPHQLSGGQQQRVALARALVLEPTVLLLDEPLGALDAKLRRQLQVELRQLQRRVGRTFVYVTHDQEEALTMSDRLAILVDGRVEQLGTPSQMYAEPASAYVAGFLGSANVYSVRVVGVAGDRVECETEGLRLVAHAPGPAAAAVTRPSAAVSVGDALTLVVRPERVEVSPLSAMSATSTGRQDDANVFAARIEHLVFRGGHTHVVLDAGCRLTAEVANVHGELPEWLVEGRDVCTRISHRAAQLLPARAAEVSGDGANADEAGLAGAATAPAPRTPSRS
jgi:spermidine/putrescine transport system ATP-binding protein